MADPRGFMTTPRRVAERRPGRGADSRLEEVYPGTPGRAVLPIISEQAGRCMDCGIPFLPHQVPLGNLIPVERPGRRSDWDEALGALHATNNFPEFTGRLCPAPWRPRAWLASTVIRSPSRTSKSRSSTGPGTSAG